MAMFTGWQKLLQGGAKEIEGAEVEMRRVPETLSTEILVKMGDS
jgi:hypothetical protein